MLFSRATSHMCRTVGPSGTGSAHEYHSASCTWQKYGPMKSSCRQVTRAPCAAASRIAATAFFTIESLSPVHFCWTKAARTTSAMPASSPGANPHLELLMSTTFPLGSGIGVPAARSGHLTELAGRDVEDEPAD